MDTDTVKVLQELIETCKDGENGYRDAAEHVKRADLKSFFQEQSSERGRFARELQTELDRAEPGKKQSGSVSAALHRAWIDIKSNLGAGDHSVLASVEQGEDSAKEAYEEALKAPLPPQIIELVRRQAQSIKAAHDRAKSLRDATAA